MTTTFISATPKELVSQHQATLRTYLGRALVQGDTLTPGELDDLQQRMSEFRAIGNSFGLTEREIVSLLFRGLLVEKQGCGCHRCRARQTD